MNYEVYKNTRDASWQFLINHRISSLPVDLKRVVAEMNVFVRKDVSNILGEREMGITVRTEKGLLIIVRGTSVADNRYTISHEIGHIVLGHLDAEIITRYDEYAAERFAIGILAPACVLWGTGIKKAEDIASLCNIPIKSAITRARRMHELYSRNKFLTSPLERTVYYQFSDFISNYKKSLLS